MRDFQIQTPLKEPTSANRRPKSTPDLSKNLRKVTRKSLNPAFKTVAEGDSSVLESPISEVSDDNPFAESVENFIAPINPASTSSSEIGAFSDMISPSFSSSATTVTSDKQGLLNDFHNKWGSPEENSFKKMESIEAEVVIKHLKEARREVLRSKGVSQSKMLLNALIDVVIEDLSVGIHEKNDWHDKILSSKGILGFLTGMPAILAVLVFWFLSQGAEAVIAGPTPT